MRCKEAEFWISLRIDGEEIPSGNIGLLDQHLMECASCRRVLSREREHSTVLGRSLRRPAGEETLLAARILAAVPPSNLKGAAGSRWRGFWLPVSVLAPLSAALLALAAGGGWWWSGSTPEVPRRDGGYALLEQNLLDTDVYSTEAGDPVRRDTLRQRWVISPVKTVPPGRPSARERGKSGEVILDVERVDTRYFRFADFQYR